jgi:hypothetical protein
VGVNGTHVRGNLVYTNGRKRLIDAFGPDVTKVMEDFADKVAASDALPSYTVTLVEAGAGESTVTTPDASGGVLLLTTDANEDDGINIQKTGEVFGFAATQFMTYFGCRLKVSDATQSDLIAGLCITDTTLLGGMTDGTYFECLDGGTGISFVTEKDSTETQTDNAGTLADDTYVTLEFCWDGSTIEAFIDGTSVANHSTNIPNDELLTPSFHFLAGAAAVKTATIDWYRAIQIGR